MIVSCKKPGTDKNNPSQKQFGTMTVNSEGKTYQLQIKSQTSRFSDTATTYIVAASADLEIYLQGASPSHDAGAGSYFLWCCANKAILKVPYTEYDALKLPDRVGTFGTQKGNMVITKVDAGGYEGTFLMYGKTPTGGEREFSGTFSVVK